MKLVLLSPRRGLWLIRPALQVAFLQWPALCRALSMVEPWQAHEASRETLSALAGISSTNQTYTVNWLKNVMWIINWEVHSVFGEFFCRKAARYKQCVIHWHWYSCLNNNPMNELYESCYSFVYPSKELFITFPPLRPTWKGETGRAQEKFWVEPGNLTSLKDWQSFIRQYFWASMCQAVTQTLEMYLWALTLGNLQLRCRGS